MRIEHIGDATLYLGDCLEILPALDKVDAVVTDPPYGVNLGTHSKSAYISFDDTPENVRRVCVPAVSECVRLFGRALVTTGVKNMWEYPKPDHIGAIYYPAATGCNAWGFSGWQPMFFYGKCPYLQNRMGSRIDSFQSSEPAEKNGHPCPKPIKQTEWMVNKASLPNETILDTFMGSGTTGVACANLGRKFIGIEIEEKYFDIACERITAAYAQGRLFE